MIKQPHIAVILLNYNSEEDLFVSIPQIQQQTGIQLTTIIVDNASRSNSIDKIKVWLDKSIPNVYSVGRIRLGNDIKENKIDKSTANTFIIWNNENKGYSAGNNIGIRLADHLGVDAVLIANPDMRFENERYVCELAKTLFLNENYKIAASKIVGIDGKDQSPLREASFWEELTWPRHMFPRIFKNTSFVLPYKEDEIITVPKVMGCCMMLRMDFLRDIHYFDENTFLYSEEPILAAQVRQRGGKIAFTPFIEALHAHVKSEKGNTSKRMLQFIESRKYYLKTYSGYNKVQLALLGFSYWVLGILHRIKLKIGK